VVAGAAFDLTDRPSWDEGRTRLAQAVDAAGRLGATAVQTTGGTARGRPFAEAAAAFGEALAPVADRARAARVAIALEPVRPQFAYAGFVHTLADGLAVARAHDLGLVVDTAHVWWEPGWPAALAEAASLAVTVQVADLRFDGPVLERVVPGDGELALAETLRTLTAAGYEGPFELEIIGRGVDEEGYESAILRSLTHLQSFVDGA